MITINDKALRFLLSTCQFFFVYEKKSLNIKLLQCKYFCAYIRSTKRMTHREQELFRKMKMHCSENAENVFVRNQLSLVREILFVVAPICPGADWVWRDNISDDYVSAEMAATTAAHKS